MSETPLTPAETQQAVTALNSNDKNQIRTTLEMLAAKSLKDPDPDIVSAIERHLTSNDRLVSRSAHNAMTKWSPEYAKRKKLEKSWQGPSPLGSTGLVVESTTPLYVGQIVQARRRNRGTFWFAAKVKQLLPDGKVELGFLTWGEERGRSSEVVTRNNIQLAPPELKQPAKPADAEMQSPFVDADGPGPRKWTDLTGRFTITATFDGVTDGKVTLKRPDGKSMRIPVEKLSKADQQQVQRLQSEMKKQADNPFKLVQ